MHVCSGCLSWLHLQAPLTEQDDIDSYTEICLTAQNCTDALHGKSSKLFPLHLAPRRVSLPPPGVAVSTEMWRWTLALLGLLAAGGHVVQAGDIFTSSAKIQAMLATEAQQLAGLRNFLQHAAGSDSLPSLSEEENTDESEDDSENDDEDSDEKDDDEEAIFTDIEDVKKFYILAEKRLSLWSNETSRRLFVRHPTNAFFAIKHAHTWFQLRHNSSDQLREELLPFLSDVFTPGPQDMLGAAIALIRLQRTYDLAPADTIRGNILGRQGFPLTTRDALLVAKASRLNGNLEESGQWLTLLLDMDDVTDDVKAAALGQLGLISLTLGHTAEAEQYLEKASVHGKYEDSVYELRMRLKTGTFPTREAANHFRDHETTTSNYSRLCARANTVSRLLPHHLCRWRCSLLPWLRYKEEVLSLAPYASIFHDVIADWEADGVKRLAVEAGLNRGTVIIEDASFQLADFRTSDTVFLGDDLDPLIQRLSKRVELMTGLQTKQRWPNGYDSAEPFQVVNYGIGGHYSAHHDPVLNKDAKPPFLKESGDRLATFLIYLEDVEVGGKTVFVSADVSVPSVKGTALFWYNFDPTGEMDQLTLHAGCPVAIGEKWVTNKWIWDNGNTFRRPCPRRPRDNQWEIEKNFHTTCP